MKRPYLFLSLLFIALFFVSVSCVPNDEDCVYTLYVKTGSIIKAGTDSNISLTLSNASGRSVWVPRLRSWGLMGPKHDYFERANLDIFSGRGPCIGGPVCRLELVSDGSGSHHGWYCDYVEITSVGPYKHCGQTMFYVDQWLATDVPPYKLTATIDECWKAYDDGTKQGILSRERFVVGLGRDVQR